MTTPSSQLRQRRQQRTRTALVDAAYALFAERGFDAVTVNEIAERAETGRTTFFRYFGDKQEVVFADQDELVEMLTRMVRSTATAAPLDLEQALALLAPAILEMCRQVTADRRRYRLYESLLAKHPELRSRAQEKLQRFAAVTHDILRDSGAPDVVATLAPQLALGCYHAGHQLAGGKADRLTACVAEALGTLTPVAASRRGRAARG